MEGRMFNTFYRITKNKRMAKFLSYIGYRILLIYYFIARLFLRGTVNIRKQEAYKKVNSVSEKPNGEYLCKERKISKDINLSIIVPAYNASKYISTCINSIVNQVTKYKFEIIIINDGSTDNTLEKLNEFKKYKNIKIINQANKGFSGARNRGIDEACGQYLMFVDSDDLIYQSTIEVLLNNAYERKADIVQGSYCSFNNNGEKFYTDFQLSEKEGEVLIPGFPWGKIYKAELFEKVRFPLNYWYEDTIVNYLLGDLCKKYVSISYRVYGYRLNPEGITEKSKNSTKVLDSYWIIEEMFRLRNKLGLKVNEHIYEMTIMQLSNLLYRRIHNLDEDTKKNTFVLACNLIEEIKINNDINKSLVFRDIENAFVNSNYRLWKVASFVI